MPAGGAAPKDCARACYGDASGARGYPSVAFKRDGLGSFLCPSNFRDAADWVYAWPWSHFSEKSWVAPSRAAAKCLGDVPLIYAHATRGARGIRRRASRANSRVVSKKEGGEHLLVSAS